MTYWPIMTHRQAMSLLRIVTPALFMAHAIVRIVNNTIPNFAIFMGDLGFPYPTIWVWTITVAELVAGTAILIGWKVRLAVIPLLAIASVGIILIHWRLGWFVGEHGTGGSEYSVALIVMLLVIASNQDS